jgi:hypothetical protein
MLICLLANASTVETLLNNLSEADFDLAQVSVIMYDVKTRDKIAKDVGPLKGVHPDRLAAELNRQGLAAAAAQHALETMQAGQVLVAMNVDPQSASAAREMFQDMKAEILKE